MLISYERDKLINAILFFAWHSQFLDQDKLFKLLYLLDVGHFQETGLTVTGMPYHACMSGPVPLTLARSWPTLPPDLAAAIGRQKADPARIYPKRPVDPAYFTPREMRIMAALAQRYGSTAAEGIDVTAADNGAWRGTLCANKGQEQMIDYTQVIDRDHPYPEAIFEAAAEYRALMKSGRIFLALASPPAPSRPPIR